MSSPLFKPYVGNDYSSCGIFRKRILALGDSHYCADVADAVPSLTRDVVARFLASDSEREDWMSTYRKFERSLVGRMTSHQDSLAIWQSIAFYNFLQEPLSAARQAGTAMQYAASADAFFSVLDSLRPQLLIVWGHRLWEHLPPARYTSGPRVSFDGHDVLNGFYSLSDGSSVRALAVHHPSAAYSWDWWHSAILSVTNL